MIKTIRDIYTAKTINEQFNTDRKKKYEQFNLSQNLTRSYKKDSIYMKTHIHTSYIGGQLMRLLHNATNAVLHT